jgi:DNA-binding CsgD family transcriptional regulator
MSFRNENRKPSPRQQSVIELVAEGLKNRDIAEKLGIDAHVVRNYLGVIYDKIGLNNRVELALWYEARVHEGKLPRRLTVAAISSDDVSADQWVHTLRSGPTDTTESIEA